MIEAMFSGLVQVFEWPTFGFMLMGIAVGYVVGLLPGLGGLPSLALMLPFTYTMEPIAAIALLLGAQAVFSTTGDVTSVLFGVPGEAASAAVILDGHAMAKKGEAGRALGAALFSSLVGAVFGALVLAASIPIVQPLVLSLGTPELFMLAVLGITFIASVSGRSVIKGIVMGGLGLLLSTVGMDPQQGVLRYTFGQPYLHSGLSLAVIAVGLFAIPELLELGVRRSSIAKPGFGKTSGALEGIKDTLRHWGLVLRCSAIGALIGILPGLGSGVGQWVAYGHAVQSSPNKERFGTGAVEGILGPGAANNSTTGGSLLLTISFGVPGGSHMALLLGAFLILGLVPGRDMLSTHLDLTFSMVWVIVIANIITVGLSLLFIDQLARITFVKSTLLIPFILLLIYLGGFATHNMIADLVAVVVFGILGTLMVWLDWPRPPLILGLVLGDLAERYFHICIARYGWTWLLRPGVIIIIILIIVALLYPLWHRRWGPAST